MSKSYTNLLYHIVFSTRERRPIITADRRQRLYEYIGGTLRNLGGIALAIGGIEDHLHALAKLRPDKALSDVLRDLKANSSGWMHDIFPELRDFSWQRGYGAFTVSASQVQAVSNYIANQEKHHERWSFQDEFVEMLRVNHIDFDEKFLWKWPDVCRRLCRLSLLGCLNPGSRPGLYAVARIRELGVCLSPDPQLTLEAVSFRSLRQLGVVRAELPYSAFAYRDETRASSGIGTDADG